MALATGRKMTRQPDVHAHALSNHRSGAEAARGRMCGSCLVEPILSCTETIIVGRIGTVMLAALGPGTQLFNIIGEVAAVFSVCTVTTVSRCAAAGYVPALRCAVAPSPAQQSERERRGRTAPARGSASVSCQVQR